MNTQAFEPVTPAQLASQLATLLWQAQGTLALPALLAQHVAHGQEQPSPLPAFAVYQLLAQLQILIEEASELALRLENEIDPDELPAVPVAAPAATPAAAPPAAPTAAETC